MQQKLSKLESQLHATQQHTPQHHAPNQVVLTEETLLKMLSTVQQQQQQQQQMPQQLASTSQSMPTEVGIENYRQKEIEAETGGRDRQHPRTSRRTWILLKDESAKDEKEKWKKRFGFL